MVFYMRNFHAEGVAKMRDMDKKRKTTAEFKSRCFTYTVRIADNTGIPKALRNFCGNHGVSVNSFIAESIAEKLSHMDVHSLSIAEIEQIERGEMNES